MRKFSEDLERYRAKGATTKELWLEPAVWCIGFYRFANWLYVDHPPAVIRIPMKALAFFLMKFCLIFMEMDLNPQASIGGGLYIAHIGGVHINPGAVIGRNCDLAHRITIGASAMGRKGVPVVGDDVYIGTGAVLVGKIKIGNKCKIAANTLVIMNVPEGATVMGVPGRIVMRPPNRPVPTSKEASSATETINVQ